MSPPEGVEWIPDLPDEPADVTIDLMNFDREELILRLDDYIDRHIITYQQANEVIEFADLLRWCYEHGARISRN